MTDTSTARSRLRRTTLLLPLCALTLATCTPALMAGTSAQGAGDSDGGVLGTRSGQVTVTSLTGAAGADAPAVSALSAVGPAHVGPTNGSPLRPGPTPADQGAGRGDASAAGEDRAEASDPRVQAPAELGAVTVQRPSIRLRGEPDHGRDLVQAALRVDGVSFANALRLASVPLAVADDEEVTVAVVEPRGFRVLTPQVTAEAVDVWKRISEGDAAFTHDVGNHLQVEHGIDLGGRVPIRDGAETLRIGAYASNGIPPVAEAVISKATASDLGIVGLPTVLVALDEGVAPDAVLADLERATGLEGEVIPEPPTRRAFLEGAATRDAFEPFTYVSLGDGMIAIDPAWVEAHIVRAQVPIFRGEVVCHRLLIPQLRGALEEIVDRGLDHLIDPSQYGGCWVPRHILFDPDRRLSMHAWGLAIDFNVKGNEYGNPEPEMDPRIVEIFERWGFVWGGHWSTPDGMHFELGALLDEPE